MNRFELVNNPKPTAVVEDSMQRNKKKKKGHSNEIG